MKISRASIGSIRKREVSQPQQHTEYYLFNSQSNLKAYSDDIMSFAYYGYNAANTRAYKLSLYNTNIWINGQQEPLNMQLQQAMFYPNTYLNFNGNGEYTKHYYNGTERIASRLGDNTTTIALNNNILEDRKLSLEEHFRVDIHKLIYETVPIDMPPFIDVNTLQPTGTPNDIYYYHPNHLGSTSFVTDQNQTITQGFLYAPFGEITTEYNVNFGNNVIPKYSFNAKELDEETGMYYYEARYYAPPTFISRDPLMSEKPWLTPYHYCSNNPVGKVDPTGLFDTKSEAKQYKKENHITGKVKHDGQSWSIQDKKNNVSYYKDNSDNYLVGKGADGVVKSYLAVAPKQGKTSTQKSSNKGQGWGVSLDVNLSWAIIGYSVEVGYVKKAFGNGSMFYSHGPSVGFEASVGLNGFWIPNSDFNLSDFEGQSMNVNVNNILKYFNVGIITDHSRGAEKDYYFNNYGGIKVGVGAGVGGSISHTKTTLFQMPKRDNTNVPVYYQRGHK